jgi:hypothetical protein
LNDTSPVVVRLHDRRERRDPLAAFATTCRLLAAEIRSWTPLCAPDEAHQPTQASAIQSRLGAIALEIVELERDLGRIEDHADIPHGKPVDVAALLEMLACPLGNPDYADRGIELAKAIVGQIRLRLCATLKRMADRND